MKHLTSFWFLGLLLGFLGSACSGKSTSSESAMPGGGGGSAGAAGEGQGIGAVPGTSGGGASGSCNVSQGARCAATAVSSNVTTSVYATTGSAITFSDGAQGWTSYTYASAGQMAPAIVPSADELSIQAQVLASSNGPSAFVGVGLYYASQACADISAYRAVTFTLTGDLGGCVVRVFVEQSVDLHVTDDSVRGRCTDATCYGPSFDVAASGDVTVPLSNLRDGVPCPALDPRSVTSLNWFFHLPDDATTSDSCATNVVLSQVRFVE